MKIKEKKVLKLNQKSKITIFIKNLNKLINNKNNNNKKKKIVDVVSIILILFLEDENQSNETSP